MWPVFDPDVFRQLATIRQMAGLTRQTPTCEWPLIVVDQYALLLVIREWPDGSITSYAASVNSDVRHDGT